jgi:hypothetical protein
MPLVRRRPVLLPVLLAVAAVLGTAGCAASSGAAGSIRPLPTHGVPDYQLGGAATPPAGVTIVERDSTEHPAPGTYGICYVNGFQTQPDEADAWLDDHPDAVLRGADGHPVADPGWPDEMLLDTTTATKRAEIVTVLTRSIARCADRGFDAVEFDNLDSWTRSHGALTRAGNLALARALVTVGHEHGLAVGQKNTPQLGAAGRERTGFDFVVAEECVHYRECGAYTSTYGDRVIDVEYSDQVGDGWAAVCADPDRPAMTILRDRDLVVPSDDAYVFAHC